ncbi:helix-turn-helix domain-containing protein [Butyricicoccus faecihominis]|uniref:helix-turn-helix domain-containing protein n=1 Tax=Butyricicoccus faecihominis TaxID=1712515 RepID=UPI002478A8A5|nr:helix-turn-helix transcriptional regulator [Butyricicoccus faecihominis]MCQ5129974.1 helix-turn-helix domain-containing protein [Butyricicoccus faecihominis]
MNRIKELRKIFGYSQQKLADLLGDEVTQTAVSQWESGRTAPRPARQAQLAEIFGVSEDELMGRVKPERQLSDTENSRLSEQEQHLLDCFRGTDDAGRKMIAAVADLEYERRRNELLNK